MRSLDTLAAAQSSRLRSAEQPKAESSPARRPGLEAIHKRNQLLDFIFYDLGVVLPHEAEMLGDKTAAEGVILSVGPSTNPHLDVSESVEQFLERSPGEIGAITVSGVGSSALGSAAFARNVADAIEKPVIGVVSGYGLTDVVAEALGGFFWFGLANSVRHMLEPFEQVLRPEYSGAGTFPAEATESSTVAALRNSNDVKTLVALLQSEPACELLVGHSKGNLVISEALFALRERDPERLAAYGSNATVVTVSARVAMPREFRKVIDVMGQFDPLGELNSRYGIENDIEVSFASHHTNTDLLFHLPVTRKVAEALEWPHGRPASGTTTSR